MKVSGKSKTRLAASDRSFQDKDENRRTSDRRANAGGTRRRSIPRNLSFNQRDGPLCVSQFDAGASAHPTRPSSATWPKTRLRQGKPCF